MLIKKVTFFFHSSFVAYSRELRYIFRIATLKEVSDLDKEYEKEHASHGIFWASIVAVLPFLVVAFANIRNQQWLDKMDQSIGQAAVDMRSDFVTSIARVVTILGGTKFSILFLAIACMILFFLLKRRDLAIWYGLTAALGAGALNQTVKFLFKKPRPLFEHLVEQGGYTFPSGHAMGSIIIYGGLAFILSQFIQDRNTRKVISFLLLLLVVVIGLSRIYLGVHFASDIIGGYSLGGSALLACIGLYQKNTASI